MGFADIAEKKEVDLSVTYNAYSVTKTFTSLAILQLFGKGKIDIKKGSVIFFNRTGMSDKRFLDKPDNFLLTTSFTWGNDVL